jgi:hypothetical protein
MIIVRNCFVAKPGNASKLAAQLKEAMVAAEIADARILTDLTGDFNRVVLEFQVQSLADVEGRMKQYQTDENFKAKMKGYTDLWSTGHRELLEVM